MPLRRLFPDSRRRLLEAVVGAAVVVSAFLVFDHASQRLESKGGEWQYIYSSRYFANLFTGGGPANPEWGDSYWTHDQPMVAHYALGAWLSARGHDVYQMPDPWSSFKTGWGNFVVGPVPDNDLLGEARALMVFFASGVALLVYLVGRVLAGPIAGLSAAALLLSRPLFSQDLVWVQTESLLMLLVVLALLLALLGARRGTGGSVPVRWAIPLGIALGLGFGTKLTAGFSLAAVGIWMVAVGAAAGLRDPGHHAATLQTTEGSRALGVTRQGQRPQAPEPWLPALAVRLRFAVLAARGWLLALGIGLSVFVLSNPHLYANPIVHTGHFFTALADSYMERSSANDQVAVPTLAERIEFVLHGSLMGLSATSSQESFPQKALGLGTASLALVGFSALSVKALKAFRIRGAMPWEAIALLTVLVYFSGVSAGLELSRARYIVPTALLSAVLFGVGIGVLSRALMVVAARSPKRLELVVRIGGRRLRPPSDVVTVEPHGWTVRA